MITKVKCLIFVLRCVRSDGFEAQGNVLMVSSKGTQSYTLGHFEDDGVMTQFTRKRNANSHHYSSEWSPILYLKIPVSINVTIDESIAEQVTER